jgi:peptidoglycan-N-acetylglucosamine deacetylase
MSAFALTFDDGPDRVWTPAVLDALRRARALATFFVLGPRAAAAGDVVRRMRSEGHTVGVHAYAHVRHSELDATAGERDLDRALAALAGLGVAPRHWRTPWGVEAGWTRPLAARRGLRLAGWTADTHDWRGDGAGAMFAAIEPDVRAGAVVLAHDGLGPGALRDGCAETVALIEPLVGLARSRGLEPEPLA